ncbi:TetR/AcrR family transcriptional regulator [Natronospirillum operosum]|uniref:TetR/AcrR family transcriptional regulator n=1 Tax=Natronospirillum operosum TaxID=2759953 RepID=A0A4Z0WBZ6_9GAMM|nr:TetR/AcrR family transcriptional regulator [Natronospirillum operosum]TGG91735.1 TetR/AcrR family transcriptional regulator [Natronospirillum operosum]
MARTRSIDQESILDAAEAVVARDGATRLTLEAVAAQAGVSKASVLYDYKNKQALIAAVVRRATARDNAFNQSRIEALGSVDSPTIRGRIDAASQPFPEEFGAVALQLCAALAQDQTLRGIIQTNQQQTLASVLDTAKNPRGARLAYLALEGLKLLESLDYLHWPDDVRRSILDDINWLVDSQPGTPTDNLHTPLV